MVPVARGWSPWAAERMVHVDDHPIVDHCRFELWRWLREQSVTETTHRYGAVVGRVADRLEHGGAKMTPWPRTTTAT
jgi:hypothetical protein